MFHIRGVCSAGEISVAELLCTFALLIIFVMYCFFVSVVAPALSGLSQHRRVDCAISSPETKGTKRVLPLTSKGIAQQHDVIECSEPERFVATFSTSKYGPSRQPRPTSVKLSLKRSRGRRFGANFPWLLSRPCEPIWDQFAYSEGT